LGLSPLSGLFEDLSMTLSNPSHVAAAGRLAAVTLIAQFLLILATFTILSGAINWPASLDDPASVALPRLVTEATPVMLGYGSYLIAALLLVPAAAGINGRLGLTGPVAGLILALATLSAIAKAIGISRWLFAMPGLAQAYVAPGADQQTVALVYETLNAYAGGIGEILGVGLVSGVWTLLVGWSVLRSPGLVAKGLGVFLLVAGVLLLMTLPTAFGVELGPLLMISSLVWQFSLLGLGLWSLTRPRAS
jgi:hypothetical protein